MGGNTCNGLYAWDEQLRLSLGQVTFGTQATTAIQTSICGVDTQHTKHEGRDGDDEQVSHSIGGPLSESSHGCSDDSQERPDQTR
ncbi:uncharacterized protein IUM83_09599 [Phytophthora cinnamomi]|uniref:uncharacterized protein n=1 Tax=Phytophthora cinnamomi TaxID=4785 RepID=UPI00355AB35C|nr:hypothetical protein IUM83_09599 [Phytophthora cinnamomi]